MHKQGALREFGHYAAMNILGMIGISCYILADTYFVAQGLGSLGLAALNIAIPAYNLMNGIGLMLGVGAATQYTIARAQNDRRQADSVFTHAAALGLLLGLLFLLGGLCFAKPLAGLLGADAQTLGMTTTYCACCGASGPFFVMNNVLLAFTRNDGAPTVAHVRHDCGQPVQHRVRLHFHFPVRTGHVRCGACDRLFAVCQHSGAADAPEETVPRLPSRQNAAARQPCAESVRARSVLAHR